MDFKTFRGLLEDSPRVQPIEPYQEKNPAKRKTLKQVKSAGDVGKREILRGVTGQALDRPGQYQQAAKDVTSQAIGTTYDSGLSYDKVPGDDPGAVPTQAPSPKGKPDAEGEFAVDRMLNLVRPYALKQREAERTSGQAAAGATQRLKDTYKDFAKNPGDYTTVNSDGETVPIPLTPAQEKALSKLKRLDLSSLTDEQKKLLGGLADDEIDSGTAAERMQAAADAIASSGALTGDKGIDDEMNKLVRTAYADDMREPIDLGTGEEQGDIAFNRYTYRPEAEFGDTITPDDVGTMASLVASKGDPKLDAPASPSGFKADPQSVQKGEDPESMDPAGRDVMAYTPDELENAIETGQITRDEADRQLSLLVAMADEDAEEAGRLVKTAEVPEESIDAFYQHNDFSTAAPGNLSTLKMAGLTSDERKAAAYGGDLPAIANKYKVAEGVYDWNKLGADPRTKHLLPIAQKNRERALIKTYLSQKGRDGYALHGGMDSIKNMDLEHVKNFASGGLDHPDNWLWVGRELNQLKNEYNLVDRIADYAQDQTTPDVGDYTRNTFSTLFPKGGGGKTQKRNDFVNAFPEFGGKNPTIGHGGMPLEQYAQFDTQQIQDFRDRAVELGVSQEEAVKMFPDVEERVTRAGYLSNPQKYEALRRKREADRVLRDTGLVKIGQSLGLKTLKDTKNTPEGKEWIEITHPGWGQEEPAAPQVNDDEI